MVGGLASRPLCSAAAALVFNTSPRHTSIGDVGGQAIAYAILGEAPPGSIGGSDHAAADEAASQAIADLVDAAQAAAEASLEAAEGPKRSSASPLAVLHLADCGLGPRAAAGFAAVLASARCALRQLWLGGNPLTAEGAAAVASGASQAGTLERLCRLDNDGRCSRATSRTVPCIA